MMDIFPTVAKLCGGTPSSNPVDGIDVWPMLSGAKPEIQREALLYFDDVHLQCARLGRFKLHISRYTTTQYNPPPVGGRKNLPLKHAELYDLVADPDESYDVAPAHPEIAADIRARIERLIQGFPEPIRADYEQTKMVATGDAAIGALPHQ